MTGLLCLSEAYYLPKDDEYYQFCYIDQDGVVRGASVPFQFRAETEDDILVVTTQVCVLSSPAFSCLCFYWHLLIAKLERSSKSDAELELSRSGFYSWLCYSSVTQIWAAFVSLTDIYQTSLLRL